MQLFGTSAGLACNLPCNPQVHREPEEIYIAGMEVSTRDAQVEQRIATLTETRGKTMRPVERETETLREIANLKDSKIRQLEAELSVAQREILNRDRMIQQLANTRNESMSTGANDTRNESMSTGANDCSSELSAVLVLIWWLLVNFLVWMFFYILRGGKEDIGKLFTLGSLIHLWPAWVTCTTFIVACCLTQVTRLFCCCFVVNTVVWALYLSLAHRLPTWSSLESLAHRLPTWPSLESWVHIWPTWFTFATGICLYFMLGKGLTKYGRVTYEILGVNMFTWLAFFLINYTTCFESHTCPFAWPLWVTLGSGIWWISLTCVCLSGSDSTELHRPLLGGTLPASC